ncbi:hypothetical protein DUNSADRAFT_9282 [Dunaliella salina]|uniref:BZIP domain-containing protein n=1 Tax=Dunaliella salina TaxID=3046 RepID=A0ABQ7GHU0_DUNSA|nr:hypothetical protein DUNSADRAFT_9282 [Dunaliella salina]|eukprot:KAF5834163.1 hypothetical protein DUNSADRAFT_9282 [Dunaliella salina]
MQAEEEGAANRTSERRRNRQRAHEQAQLRAPQLSDLSLPLPPHSQSGWTSQPAPLVESPQPPHQFPLPRSPFELPQPQQQQGQDAATRGALSSSASSGERGGGTSSAEEEDRDTEGTSPPSDPEAGALPHFGPKPPRSPPGNVVSSSSSDGDAPSGPRAAPSMPRSLDSNALSPMSSRRAS